MQPIFDYWEPLEIPLGGNFSVHGFGILVALGFVLGAKYACDKAAKDGFDPEIINRLVGWLVLGVFVGGHLGHLLFYYPEQLVGEGPAFGRFFDAILDGRLPRTGEGDANEIPAVLQVWQGLSSFGGFLACTVLSIWFFRKERVPLWPYADAVAFGMMMGWMMGRFGCFSAHDHPGTETNFFLGVRGTCPGNAPLQACHALGLYEALWSGAMFLWFWFMNKVPRHPGFYLGWMCLSYGPVRLWLDVYRHPKGDPRITEIPFIGEVSVHLTPAQYGSMLLTVIGLAIILRKRKHAPIQGDWKPKEKAKG